jgi:broad specificity phosphatase PhoE
MCRTLDAEYGERVTEMLLVRHGETDWNRKHRVQGHTDVPLNAAGTAQAEALADRLASVRLAAVYSSDLARARQTAEIVAWRQGLDVVLEPGLREKNFGSWEGLTDIEIAERFPDAVRGRWGDGETTEEVAGRALTAIERIRAREHDGPVVVVSHGGAIRTILDQFSVEHGRIGNCEIFSVEL